jgi:uncharacterized protein YdaT
MSNRTKLHVTSSDGGWKVKREGAERAASVQPTKQEAIDKARKIAKSEQPSQVIVHKKDGTIQTEYTYRKDPFPPKG